MLIHSACQIRVAQHADSEQMLIWRNRPEVRAFMYTQHEITLQEHLQWFERAQKDPTQRVCIIEEDGIPLGVVNFTGVGKDNVAKWGFYAAPNVAKGAGTKIGLTALEFAFNQLGLHKICGEALVFNEASVRMHLKLGFVQEGVLRKQQQINDNYHDVICFGLLRDEWIKKVSST